ncbi:MAG: MoaD/ThiS family protein [Pseudomonadota bacterium]|nr:MoaD/ThiS family protein [Pseudomonadota bacterium]
MQVVIPPQLRNYTHAEAHVEARGTTVAEILADLDRQFPGIRFRIVDEQDRIRPHLRIFVNEEQTRILDAHVATTDRILIFGALSGG